MTKEVVNFGHGILTWPARERRTDRYGAVYLIQDGADSMSFGVTPSLVNELAAVSNDGRQGTLVATVVDARESTHIGDVFRGVFPRTPQIGTRIVLGSGKLFSEPAHDGGVIIGLQPEDGRKKDWLDIRALYDAHEQLVNLEFYPEERKS
jgi:hypothetical protein